MSSVVISGDTSGAITLAAPAVSGTNTATLPAATGTVMVSGNMPAFSAYNSASQTVTTSTETKAVLNTEDFDTASAFDSTTNYRFTPTVAGYYQVNGQLRLSATSMSNGWVSIYKNGTLYLRGMEVASGTTITEQQVVITCLIYLNGSTDYLELWGYIQGTGTCQFVCAGTPYTSRMQASMVRSA